MVADLAHRHNLDERQVVATGMAPSQHVRQFVLVDAFHGDGVDFDLEARRVGRCQSVHHSVKAPPAGNGEEFFRVIGYLELILYHYKMMVVLEFMVLGLEFILRQVMNSILVLITLWHFKMEKLLVVEIGLI